MRRFVTIFPEAENVHLTKELGLIPYVLHKHFDYDGSIASYQNGTYPTIEREVSGLKQMFIKRIFDNQLADVLWFLLFNFFRFDVISVYHFTHTSWISGLFFKLLTLNKGKVYLKLDADERLFNYKPRGYKKRLSNFIFSHIDLVSVENKSYARRLNEAGVFGRAVELIPNGFYGFGSTSVVDFFEKENLMITVGRIGTLQKATEVLCKAFVVFSQKDTNWRLEIIGPVADSFKTFISDFFLKYPEMLERITFVGSVNERDKLEKYYRRAKIFVLTSRWEGFPNVFLEAISKGCFVISSDLPAAYDITDHGKYGCIFPVDDVENLAMTLENVCGDQYNLEINCKAVQKFAFDNYHWVKICERLNYLLT